MQVNRAQRKLIKAVANSAGPLHWSRLSGADMTAAHTLSAKRGIIKVNMERAEDWSLELTQFGRDWWNQHKDD